MTQVRFGGSDPWAYQAAKWTYNLPEKAEKFLSPKVGKTVGGFVKKQLDSDFAHFTNMSLGSRFKTLLAEPPKLPLLLLLYPGTVGPRLYRAYQRGKEINDYREMGDVLRRDLTAITLFVFALTPMVNWTSKRVQNLTKVNLVKKEGGVLSYSDFRNYEITNPKALWQVVKEGNGEGLAKAIKGLKEGGLTEKYKALNPAKDKAVDLVSTLKKLKSEVQKFVDEYDPKQYDVAKKGEHAPLQRAGEVFEHFEQVKKDVQIALQEGGNEGSKEVIEIAKNLQGHAKDALKNYAKVRRLPSDMLSFAVMVGLIGWFPMWFNGVWNKKQFEKKQAAGTANAPAQPALPPQPVQRAFPQPVNFQPFTPFPSQRPANPFNRQG